MPYLKSSERRLKLILMLQQSNKRLTVDYIAEKFSVSRRTVFRDFNALSELNVPVTHDKYQGYGIMDGYSIPPLMFNTKELATIMVGLNFVKSQVDATMVDDAKGVELKIKEVLSDKLNQFFEAIEERMVVDPYMHYGPDKKKGGNWYEISNAIAGNNRITFQYDVVSSDKKSQRKVDPYLLVFYRDHWNMIGYCHKREAVRNFILEQMHKINVMEEDFVPYGKTDPEPLIFRSGESDPLIKVYVREDVYRRFRANLPAKIIKENKENPNLFQIDFRFDNLDFINKWLMQFPEDVEIIEPEALLEKRGALLRTMLGQHK